MARVKPGDLQEVAFLPFELTGTEVTLLESAYMCLCDCSFRPFPQGPGEREGHTMLRGRDSEPVLLGCSQWLLFATLVRHLLKGIAPLLRVTGRTVLSCQGCRALPALVSGKGILCG